ncbi:MAG: trypsin-like peptidase domain-containing protein [Tepidiformaceae bacterium]
MIASVAAISAVVGGVVAGATVAWWTNGSNDEPATAAPLQSVSVEQTSAIAEAAVRVRPSVVRIESTRRAAGGIEQDIGSGVILDTEGHMVTNAHVVLGTDTLKVVLADGTVRPAIMVGHDSPFTDVAVLQIGPGGLTPVEVGDSATLQLGESVVAIGNPLAEFDGSVSVGVISGTGRVRILDGVKQDDLLQTDAAINSGNSGGALINLEGQFIGMPTAVIRDSRSGVAVEGIAFALPSNRVLEIANEIIRVGANYPRPSLEAEHLDLTPESLSRLPRATIREGAFIGSVLPGGAADAAGIRAGDVITEVDGVVLEAETPLLNVMEKYQPGETVRVVLNRNGRIIEAEVRFALRS